MKGLVYYELLKPNKTIITQRFWEFLDNLKNIILLLTFPFFFGLGCFICVVTNGYVCINKIKVFKLKNWNFLNIMFMRKLLYFFRLNIFQRYWNKSDRKIDIQYANLFIRKNYLKMNIQFYERNKCMYNVYRCMCTCSSQIFALLLLTYNQYNAIYCQ